MLQWRRRHAITALQRIGKQRHFVLQSQQQLKHYTNKTPIRKLKICALVGYYAAYNGNSFPTFRHNLSVPYSRVSPTRTRRKSRTVHVCGKVTVRHVQRFETVWIRKAKLLTPLSFLQHCTDQNILTSLPTVLSQPIASQPPAPASGLSSWISWPLKTGPISFPRDVGKELPM